MKEPGQIADLMRKVDAASRIAKWSNISDDRALVPGMAWVRKSDGEKEWLTWGDFHAIAAALASARAEGMREAARIAENEGVRPETNVYGEFMKHNRRIRDTILSAIGGQK